MTGKIWLLRTGTSRAFISETVALSNSQFSEDLVPFLQIFGVDLTGRGSHIGTEQGLQNGCFRQKARRGFQNSKTLFTFLACFNLRVSVSCGLSKNVSNILVEMIQETLEQKPADHNVFTWSAKPADDGHTLQAHNNNFNHLRPAPQKRAPSTWNLENVALKNKSLEAVDWPQKGGKCRL